MIPVPAMTIRSGLPPPMVGAARPRPKRVKSIWDRTTRVISMTTLAPARPTGTPRSTRSHAFTTFPPIWRTGRRSLIDSPIQRALSIERRGGLRSSGMRRRQPMASAHIGGRWKSAMTTIPHPALPSASATSPIPCQAMTAAKSATPATSPAWAVRERRSPRSVLIGVLPGDCPGCGSAESSITLFYSCKKKSEKERRMYGKRSII